MIRVVMFDLGLTLIDAHDRPFEHVPAALAAIGKFTTGDGKPLRCCLVSDFTMATPPVTPKKVRPLFEQYLAVLDATGLRPFFEPVSRRVTLSTHANALKPDRAVFETALRRLRVHATLGECLLITENADHIAAARTTLGMQALRFVRNPSGPAEFGDWAQAPALVAHLVDPAHVANVHTAVEAFLAADGVELTSLERGAGGAFDAAGRVWCPVSVAGVGGQKPVHVAVPVYGKVTLDAHGGVHSHVATPADSDVAEAAAFVGSLATHGQIATEDSPSGAGATHEIVADDQGRQRLVRKRFSAT